MSVCVCVCVRARVCGVFVRVCMCTHMTHVVTSHGI